jgi:hypothetical protein
VKAGRGERGMELGEACYGARWQEGGAIWTHLPTAQTRGISAYLQSQPKFGLRMGARCIETTAGMFVGHR